VTEVLAPRRAGKGARVATPYMGLVPYGEEDAEFFFGRSEEKQVVIGNLRAARLTILYGPSGVGKTSLLQAGVLHDLRGQVRDNVAAGRAPFAICAFRAWREDPLPAVVKAVHAACTEASGGEELPAWTVDMPLVQTVREWTQQVRTLLVVLDEFQDYFLYHRDENGEGTFGFEFPRLVNEANLRVHFLLSLREDAWARLDRFTGQIPRLFANYLRVEHLDRDGGREAIVRPLEQWNAVCATADEAVTIEPELVDAVLTEVEIGKVLVEGAETGLGTVARPDESRIEAPYLQLVLNRLWVEERRADSHVLRLQTLQRLGGARRIISTHLDTTMAAFPERDQDVAARAFRFLVTPSGAKIAHRAGDLAELTEVPSERLDPVLDRLAGEPRILRHVGENAYEIYHDALAGPILAWRSRWRERQQRRRERRRAGAYGLAAIVLGLVAAGFLVLFIDARNSRETARSRELAVRANAQLPNDPQEGLSLAERAVDAAPTAQAQDVLRASLADANIRAVLRGHRRAVTAAAFSRDGRLIVTASDDRTARIWDARTRKTLHVLTGHTGRVNDAAFSPDGRRIVTASQDGTARLWGVRSGGSLHVLRGHTNALSSAAFSPDGELVLTVSDDGTARVWDAQTGKSLHVLRGHGGLGFVSTAAFSPDGTLIATGTNDGILRIWASRTGKLLKSLRVDSESVESAAFSPDGRRIVTGGKDGRARISDVGNGRSLHVLRGHTGPVGEIAFSPDGRLILTTSDDRTARLWRTDKGSIVNALREHAQPLTGGVFSPDGTRIVTASDDGTARISDVGSGQSLSVLRGHNGAVYRATFSPDGRFVLTAGADGTARIWDARAGSSLRTFRAGAEVSDAAVSPGGRLIVTVAAHGGARIWDSRTGERLERLGADNGPLLSAAFSPDGRRIVTGGSDGTARIWDVGTARSIHVFRGHSGPVLGVAFSPDGHLIVTADSDGSARVWGIRDRNPRRVLRSNSVGLYRAAFSPDGRSIVGAATDGTASIWDVRTAKRRNSLPGTGQVYSAAFSRDGRLVVTAGSDGTARIWDARSGKPLRSLSGHAGDVLSAAFSPDGRLVVTGGADRTARVWVVHTGMNVVVLLGNRDAVRSAAFSPDGMRIVTATYDGTIRIYRCVVCGSLHDLRVRAREQLARAPLDGASAGS
jgi:WD40 repeat protein